MSESTSSLLARAVGRVIATALLAALTGAAAAAVFYAWHPTLRMEFDRDPPRLVSGIYPAEHDERGTLTFAWTAGDVAIRLPGLDRRVDWTILLRVRGARPLVADNPDISIVVDGLPVLTHHTAVDFEEVRATLPAHP
jgi:hypothetical protein